MQFAPNEDCYVSIADRGPKRTALGMLKSKGYIWI